MRAPSLTLLSAGIALAGLSNSVFSASDANFQLEEVVVMAQKQLESLQEAPVTVTVLNQESMGNYQLRNAQELAAMTPNMQMLGSNGDSQLVLGMRGVTQSDYSPNGTGAIALYVDEVYMGATPLASGVQLFDIERVEMLLGPQGTLFGKNATGGAVNILTIAPNLEENGGYLGLGLGNYQHQNINGAYNVVMSDKLAGRIAFTHTKNDGFVDNKYPGGENPSQINESALRASFLYEDESYTAVLRLHKSRSRAVHSSIMMIEADDGVANGGVGIGNTGYSRGDLGFHDVSSNRTEQKEFDLQGLNLTVNYDLSETYTLTSITSFDDAEYFVPEDADGSPWRLLEDDFSAKTQQFSQDLRLTADDGGDFRYMVGLYYNTDTTDGETRFRWLADSGDGSQPLANNCEDTFFLGCYYANSYKQTRKTLAAYFHSSYQITDALGLTAGLRYTKDTTKVKDYNSYYGQAQNSFGQAADGPALGSLGLDGRSETISDSNVSGKLGLDWFVNDDVMVYGAFSTGYRGSAFNGFAFDPSEFSSVAPEKLTSWEVGVKTTLQDGRTRLNIAAFHYSYENQQFLIFDNGLQTLLNAGESEIKGMEIQLTTRATEKLYINAGIGLLDAQYQEMSYAGADLSGNTLPSSPDMNANLSVDYDLWQGDDVAIGLHYDGTYNSKQYFEPFNDNRLAQESYALHNVRVNISLADESHHVGVFVKNLTDKEYVTYSVDLSGDWNGMFFFRGAPRTFGLDYKFNF